MVIFHSYVSLPEGSNFAPFCSWLWWSTRARLGDVWNPKGATMGWWGALHPCDRFHIAGISYNKNCILYHSVIGYRRFPCIYICIYIYIYNYICRIFYLVSYCTLQEFIYVIECYIQLWNNMGYFRTGDGHPTIFIEANIPIHGEYHVPPPVRDPPEPSPDETLPRPKLLRSFWIEIQTLRGTQVAVWAGSASPRYTKKHPKTIRG